MTTLHTLRVFLGPDGEGGNPLGVFLDGAAIAARRPPGRRRRPRLLRDRLRRRPRDGRAADLHAGGRAPARRAIRSSAPRGCSASTRCARPPARSRRGREGELTWIRARPEWATLYDLAQLPSVADVDAFAIPGGDAMVGVWAWEDEAAGRLRARIFPNGIGIDEDEATGAAAIQFGALLGRDVVIRQGEGSELHARPGADGTVAVGGRVALVSERELRAGGRGLTSSPPSMVETVAILCGGRGTRLAGELPKPLVEVGGLPIVWHVASIFAAPGRPARRAPHGLPRRAGRRVGRGRGVAGGRRGDVRRHGGGHADRRARARRRRGDRAGRFFLTYGDGVADVTSPALLARPRGGGRARDDDRRAARAAVRRRRARRRRPRDRVPREAGRGRVGQRRLPRARAGGARATWRPVPCSSASRSSGSPRRGGCRPSGTTGFWACMDTHKDALALNALWDSGRAPWAAK